MGLSSFLATTDVVKTSSEAHHDSQNILGETFTGCKVKNFIGSSPPDVKRKFLTVVLFRFMNRQFLQFFTVGSREL